MIAPPPLIYAVALVIGLLVHWISPIALVPYRLHEITLFSGLAVMVSAVVLVTWAFQTMGRAQTEVNPYKPATALVVEGPFRLSRNPIYIALTLIYIGITLLSNALWPLFLLPVTLLIMRFGVIAREERYLEEKFGVTYLRYKHRVRRWI